MKKIIFIYLAASFFGFSQGQSQILDQYIDEALEQNLALLQKMKAFEKSQYGEMESRGMFFPEISFQARYSVAEGGRVIDFPVGDLLNPVYGTLNRLTGSQDFPQISNEEFFFFRPREQETKLRLIQPIFDPRLYFNQKIQSDLTLVRRADMDSYKRFLIAEIKTAYYNFLKTVEILRLYDRTELLLEENLRVNRKLFENDKVTVDYIFRSQAELSNLEQKKAEARKSNQTAQAYFNFLLNRDLHEEVMIEVPDTGIIVVPDLEGAIAGALSGREDLHTLKTYQAITDKVIKLNRANRLPRVMGMVDYGIQGIDYDISADDDFLLASVVMQWDLFSGLQNNAKIQQANLDHESANIQLNESMQQISLEVIESYYDLEASREKIKATKDELRASEKVYQIIHGKYLEGRASLLEFIDARTHMTNAKQKLILTRYDYLMKFSGFERVACLYPIK